MAFPSTFLDIQTAVLTKARLDVALDTQKVKDWINQTYTRVCVETEATAAVATMAATAAVTTYTLPATVARIRQMQIKPYGTTQLNAPMIRTTLDEILTRRQAGGDTQQSSQQPSHYTLLGISTFELWPTPASADTINIWYVAFPVALAANTDVPVLEEPYASKLLEFGALADAGDFKGDPNTGQWQADFDTWMARYQQHLEAKQGVIPGQFHQWGKPWAPSGDMVVGGY